MNLNRIGHAFLTLISSTLICQVSGLFRDISYASLWGTESVAFAGFMIAYTYANAFRSLFGEGALQQSFIPSFFKIKNEKDMTSAWHFACNVISSIFIIVSLLSLVLGGISMALMGTEFYASQSETIQYLIQFTPKLIPYAVFICATAAFTAILNALDIYFLPGLNSFFFNVVIIATVLLMPKNQDNAGGLTTLIHVIVIASALQCLFLAVVCGLFKKLWYKPLLAFDNELKQFLELISPLLIVNGLHTINTFIDRCLAGFLGAFAVNGLYYAHQLIHLPVGLFGAVMAQVCLPTFSDTLTNKEHKHQFSDYFNYSLILILFLALPAVALLICAGQEIITLLYFHGKFDDASRQLTYYILLFYLPSVPAIVVQKLIVAAFSSLRKTKLIFYLSIIGIATNIVLSISLIYFLKQYGLALATSIAAIIATTLYIFFALRDSELALHIQWKAPLKLGFAAMCCGLAMSFSHPWIISYIQPIVHLPFLSSAKNEALFHLLALLMVGGLTYITAIVLIKGKNDCLAPVLNIVKRRQNKA